MRRKLSCFFLLLVLIPIQTQAQIISITGKVTDADTGEPIPFASIGIAEINKGTSSNINGDFLIKLDSLPVTLIFSHISYQKQSVRIEEPEYIQIELQPGEILLEELVVEDKDRGEYAYNLLIRALGVAINHSRDWKYGLAFYRQVSMNGDNYSELYEIFYDTRYSSMGIVDWAIQEGRYAMETSQDAEHFVYNKNFTLLTRLFTMYQPLTDKYVMPVNRNVRDLYNVQIKGLKNVEGRKVAIIEFTAQEEVYTPAMEGEIMIDIDSYEILKLDASIVSDNLEMIGLNNPEGSWKNHQLDIEITYRPIDGELHLDYIRLDQTFDYYIEDQFINPIKTSSLFTYYQYYQPEKFKRLGGRIIRFDRSDREVLDRIGYNRRFWEQNPIVLRTPIEEEIIASFEAQNAFGTIYLNDREEVQLEKDNLDFDPFIQQLKIDLKKSKLPTSGEKVYIHTDKPFYASGETIWLSAYIVNLASHIPTNISGVLYVDFISPEGKILYNKSYEVRDAFSEGNIDLDKKLPTGRYRLRGYTNWMKNYDTDFFFDREIPVYNSKDKVESASSRSNGNKDYSIQFLPEGGHLISGIPSQVAFKATDEDGRSIQIAGKVIDSEGSRIADLDTRHDGMGSFFILPQQNVRFKAEVKYKGQERVFYLPEPLNSGYSLTVNNLKNRVVQINVRCSEDLDDREFYLIGQSRGIIYHREKIRMKNTSAIVKIPKTKLPAGIFHITLFDDGHQPRCERLVFIDNGPQIFVKMNTKNEIIRYRDKIDLNFEFTDQFDRSIRNTHFSVAVTDASHMVKKPEDENIMTNLLLTSDLKGRIENPGFYFLNDDRETQIALDLLMLTHGWRRFTWKQIATDELSDTPYSHEFGYKFSGTAFLSGTRRPLKYAYVNFMSLNSDFPGYWSTTTDNNGTFKVDNIDIPDTLSVAAISVNDKSQPVEVEVEINPIERFPAEQVDYQHNPPPYTDNVLTYLNRFEERKKIEEAYDFKESIVLKEIEVKGERYRNTIYGEPDNVIEVENELEYYQDIFQIIQGRVPGVYVTGQGLYTSIRIRGTNSVSLNNEPLFVIDGMPISNINPPAYPGDSTSSAPGNSSVNSLLMSINPRDVDRIEVLKSGASTAAFGMRGANGVIVIYTKKGIDVNEQDDEIPNNIVKLPGYSIVREFYTPTYEEPDEENLMPDKRTTIYWNPAIRTDNLGRAGIEFYNSDDARSLQVEIQGVTDFGDIINATFIVGKEIKLK